MNTTQNKAELISSATRRNWERLHSQGEGRLTSRANKRLSEKEILPSEYFLNKKHIPLVRSAAQLIKDNDWDIARSLWSLGMNLLAAAGLSDKAYVVMEEYGFEPIAELIRLDISSDERDILGLIYQCLLSEGQKNAAGSYYTPLSVAAHMTKGIDFSKGQTFLDPCCGSGAFILALENAAPEQIFGIDNDPIAVMIAKFNMLLKFREREFVPQIYLADYLREEFFKRKFTYIITNPPWGAGASGETFSLFFVKAFNYTEPGGAVRFLLPRAVLNVKAYRDLRRFMLEKGNLKAVTLYNGSFSGVTTKYVDIELRNELPSRTVLVYENGSERLVNRSSFYLTKNLVFSLMSAEDERVIHTMKENGKYDLSGSKWALGIVTGDNKNMLKDEYEPGLEKIYTGREIQPYRLKPCRKYIRYDRRRLQQAARDEYYRASEKLVYKFISDRPVFACDDSGGLFLNSANILIPDIPGMSVKTVMAFLNSELFAYVYRTLFGEIKILKGNLEELKFPQITPEQDKYISELADRMATGDTSANAELQRAIYEAYGGII